MSLCRGEPTTLCTATLWSQVRSPLPIPIPISIPYPLSFITNNTVFLRVLEHYSGILFVSTTTHAITIDPSFRSRFHLALSFRPLTAAQSVRVWTINLDRLEKEQQQQQQQQGNLPLTIHRDDILAYAAESFETNRWNGRQIRNAFQTALALAQAKVRREGNQEVVVDAAQFRAVAASLATFDAFLEQDGDARSGSEASK